MEIILISHAGYAEGAVDSIKMIAGDNGKIHAIGLYELDDPVVWGTKIDELIKSLKSEKFIVFVDLFMGTPCNQAMQRLNKYNVRAFAGFNLGMILSAYLKLMSGLEDFADFDDLMNEGKDAIIDLNAFQDSFDKEQDESDF